MSKTTPMMQQYFKIKADYQDAFLFFRLGDFYELFYDDAIEAARELEITLTQRDPGQKEPVPMCGVPYHSAENYIKLLIDKGFKVAVCEQVEDPKEAKGVVQREVIQLITPGTVMESAMLNETENNYIASLSYFEDNTFVIAYNDLSTGENALVLIEHGFDAVLHELYNQHIKEIVIASDMPEKMQNQLKTTLSIMLSFEDETTFYAEYRALADELHDERMMVAFGRLLNYIGHTQKRSLDHLQPAKTITLKDYLTLDMYSKRNLELTETILKKEQRGSLLWVLDRTTTAMGSRLLRNWLERPLLNRVAIEKRLDYVEGFMEGFMERDELREILKHVYDLERLAGRISFGNVNARDLLQLKQSLEKIPELKGLLSQFPNSSITKLANQLNYPEAVLDLLDRSITPDSPVTLKEGGLIKDGYHEELDTYRDASRNGKQWIASLEKQEKEATGIRNLKIGYNRVFGYYIEVSKANLPYLPQGRYERKQTLANAERFVTPELKEKEHLILEAEDNIIELEYTLFLEIRDTVKMYIHDLQDLAKNVSQIDVLQAFATVSEANGYTRPSLSSDRLSIKKARHPVVEQVMEDATYVPNDVYMDEDRFMLLITGPNMSGKSTYMRQLALIAIMGQIGCFVPADQAELTVFDQIFTRIGAADDLVSGKSTFMVEMLEARHALENATDQSLILLDEIGRGTSTYDGMALAQAIVEHIHDVLQARTLFATHYHELTALSDNLPGLKNIHVRAEEHEGNVVFLHQVLEGPADKSYGIHVAKLADLPDVLIQRATAILNELETAKEPEAGQLSLFPPEADLTDQATPPSQALPEVVDTLQNLDLFEMTPMDAMNELYRLQKMSKQ